MSRAQRAAGNPGPRRQRGIGLVESLVTLAITAFVLVAATTAFAKMRGAQRSFDGRARLQETALHALAVIETDLRMAGFRGLSTSAPATDGSLVFPDKCGGVSWVAAAERPVDGANAAWIAEPDCAVSGGGVQPGADALVIRRASARIAPLAGGKVAASMRERVLLASRLDAATLFVAPEDDGALPAGFEDVADPDDPVEVREWLVNAYYVSRGSSAGADVPALRRKTLQAGPGLGDEEIMAGVEDLQVVIGADVDGDGAVDADFAPGALPADARAVFARVWLRVRTLDRDAPPGGTPAAAYADRVWPAIDDGHSRWLAARTVFLRNQG
jgi:type IV pilus assembly protein PilW